jgi:bacterioferritin (cytochrome b1)
MSEPTKEYLFAKAALCSDLARKQLEKQEIAEALRNMKRANRAMARIFNLDESEGE